MTTIQELRYEQIGILNPRAEPISFTVLHDSAAVPLHSPVFLGARPRPPILSAEVDRVSADDVNATGFLFRQNARIIKNTTAGWSHVRAVRVRAAKGLTVRSSHSYIVHAGSEVSELGTVPLAAALGITTVKSRWRHGWLLANLRKQSPSPGGEERLTFARRMRYHRIRKCGKCL